MGRLGVHGRYWNVDSLTGRVGELVEVVVAESEEELIKKLSRWKE